MSRKLNSTTVPEVMYNEAAAIKRGGGKAFVLLGEVPGDIQLWSAECANCNGMGTVGLGYFTGGPYQAPPLGKHVTHYEGAYYEQKIKHYRCPVCNGTGVSTTRETARPLDL